MIETLEDLTSFRWATVTQVSPLRIKLDGDAAALGLTPDSLIDPLYLAVNDRVRVELTQRKVVIHGRSGGRYSRPLTVADLDALPTATLFQEGTLIHVDSLNVDFQNRDSAWVQNGIATVSSVANRNTEYAKASAAYRVNGAQVRVTGIGIVYEYMTTTLAAVGADAWFPVWGVFPAVERIINGNSTSDGTNRTLGWETAGAFTRNIISGTDGTIELASGIFTIRQRGRWKFTSAMTWNNPGSTFTHQDIYKNGVQVRRHQTPTTSASYATNIVVYEDVLAAGDTVRTDHNAGAAATIIKTDGSDNTHIIVEYMGAA